MLTALVLPLRSIGLICRGHRAVALENLALRQRLAALKRTAKRSQLHKSDRLFWILLAKAWRDWRTALIVVQPDTVLRWHREWLRRRWTRRSTRTRPGRLDTDAAVRTLVDKMAAANALWGAPRIHGELGKLGITVSERTVSRLLRRPCAWRIPNSLAILGFRQLVYDGPCAIWPSCFSICWRRSPGSLAPAAPEPWWPSSFSSSSNY